MPRWHTCPKNNKNPVLWECIAKLMHEEDKSRQARARRANLKVALNHLAKFPYILHSPEKITEKLDGIGPAILADLVPLLTDPGTRWNSHRIDNGEAHLVAPLETPPDEGREARHNDRRKAHPHVGHEAHPDVDHEAPPIVHYEAHPDVVPEARPDVVLGARLHVDHEAQLGDVLEAREDEGPEAHPAFRRKVLLSDRLGGTTSKPNRSKDTVDHASIEEVMPGNVAKIVAGRTEEDTSNIETTVDELLVMF
ncbi:hypothetical protein HDU93_007152 [Gonapodya sp. JEL0774]|nr:hypothetical protein HDU93_007152 [Gonapodya sp. JEL0774]